MGREGQGWRGARDGQKEIIPKETDDEHRNILIRITVKAVCADGDCAWHCESEERTHKHGDR